MPAEFEQLIMEELPKRQTLLHCLRDEQEQLVRPLLALGIDINARDADGNSAMHTAASGGHAAVVRMLIMCNADPHILNKRNQDALLCAVRSKHNTMVRLSLCHCCWGVASPCTLHLRSVLAFTALPVCTFRTPDQSDLCDLTERNQSALLCSVCFKHSTKVRLIRCPTGAPSMP
jgi:hypothetical protein